MTSKQERGLQRLGIAILFLAVVGSIVSVRGSSLPVPVSAEEINEELLKPGDILFVDIYQGWSHGGYWDHMAVYSDHPYPGVVEATYNAGITYTPLPAFLERDLPADVSVRRLKDVPGREEIIDGAVEYALAQVGKPFDYTATATLPLKVNETNLHCSEVIWRAYRAAGIDLDGNDGPFVYPDDMYFCSKLRPP